MTQFTAEQIKERFDKLPQELKDAIASTDVHDELKKISAAYGLHIDQQGELVDQVGLVMLGLTSAKDFVSRFADSTGIDQATALKIAGDINSQVLDKIRSSMRTLEQTKWTDSAPNVLAEQMPGMRNPSVTPVASMKPAMLTGIPAVPQFVGGMASSAATKEQHVSSLERAGGFSIERDAPRKSINLFANDVNEKDKPAILSSIENPVVPAARPALKDDAASHYEPLVDQLLRGSTATPSVRAYAPTPMAAMPKPPAIPQSPIIPKPPLAPQPQPTAVPVSPAPIIQQTPMIPRPPVAPMPQMQEIPANPVIATPQPPIIQRPPMQETQIPKPPTPAPMPPIMPKSPAVPQPPVAPKPPTPPKPSMPQPPVNLPVSSDPYREPIQ